MSRRGWCGSNIHDSVPDQHIMESCGIQAGNPGLIEPIVVGPCDVIQSADLGRSETGGIILIQYIRTADLYP